MDGLVNRSKCDKKAVEKFCDLGEHHIKKTNTEYKCGLCIKVFIEMGSLGSLQSTKSYTNVEKKKKKPMKIIDPNTNTVKNFCDFGEQEHHIKKTNTEYKCDGLCDKVFIEKVKHSQN